MRKINEIRKSIIVKRNDELKYLHCICLSNIKKENLEYLNTHEDKIRKIFFPISLEIKDIESAICQYYGVDNNILYSDKQNQEVMKVRKIFVYLIRNHVSLTGFKDIGVILGYPDHVTTRHHYKTANNYIVTDELFRKELREIQKKLLK